MVDATIQSQLLEQLDKLPLAKQQRVVEYARSLSEPVRSAPAKDFLALSGVLDPVSAEEMTRAIEEDCEKVDPNGW